MDSHRQAENRRMRRQYLWAKIRGPIRFHCHQILFFSSLYLACKLLGKPAELAQNRYTLNHMNYNLHVFSIMIRISWVTIVCVGSQGNFDQSYMSRILDNMYKTFLFLARMAAVGYLFFVIVPDFYLLLRETS